MGAFNQSLIDAGVMRAGEGLADDLTDAFVVDFSAPAPKLEVRRVTDMSDFAEFADTDALKNEAAWRAENGQE